MSDAPRTSVLLVDDRPENLFALRAILEPLDQNLVEASSGEEALRQALREHFAVILLDVEMPGMDGFEVAEELKRLDRTRTVPIVFLTAHDGGRRAGFAYSSGAIDYMTKPVDPDILRSKVAGFVELAQASERALRAREQELRAALGELAAEKARVEAFYSYGRDLASETDAETIAQTAIRGICELVGAAGGFYAALPGANGDRRTLLASHGDAGLPRPIPSDGAAGSALALRERRGVTAETDQGFELHVAFGLRDEAPGLLTLVRGREFEPFERDAVEHLVAQAAVSFANAILLRRARREATINASLLDSTRDAISMTDGHGRVQFANARMQELGELFGGWPSEGKPDERTQLIATRLTDPEAYLAVLRAVAADPDHVATSEHLIASSGRSFQHYTAPVRDDTGEPIGRITVLRETTAEREAERVKSELVSTVSHELRTPLAGVLGFAEILLREDDLSTDERRRYLATVHHEAKRLTNLLNDFLDLQRIEAGGFTLALEPFDLRELLGQELQLYAEQSTRHSVELEAPDESVEVAADRERIAQVIGNLLTNAIKYSPDGGAVRVRLERIVGAVRIEVRDEGLGIPIDQQPNLFTKFFRVDSSDTRRIGGTGLGLALSREIVNAHGGRIGFDSVEGEGSTFWFELLSGVRARAEVLLVQDDPGAPIPLHAELGDYDKAARRAS